MINGFRVTWDPIVSSLTKCAYYVLNNVIEDIYYLKSLNCHSNLNKKEMPMKH